MSGVDAVVVAVPADWEEAAIVLAEELVASKVAAVVPGGATRGDSVRAALAEAIGLVYEQILKVTADSPAEVVLWGANYDDMLTYPPYFAQEITPWVRKASRQLGAVGKLVMGHTDTVNVDPKKWTHPPFGADREGELKARKVRDGLQIGERVVAQIRV